MKKIVGAALLGVLALGATAASSPAAPVADPQSQPLLSDAGALSVMSYNVKGLPWPIASGRPANLAKIGKRLAEMRRLGGQPHIVLLQEAFSDEAKAIATTSGYRYVARGPGLKIDAGSWPQPLGAQFAARASWLKGETEGKWQDSGLLILSDYPIVGVERMAFPEGACAGYDCLANKGLLLAWVRIPGEKQPLAVVDTHLNARGASGVSDARSDAAFAWQMAAVREFIEDKVPAAANVIFAGDFNIGLGQSRISATGVAGPLAGGGEAVNDALVQDRVDWASVDAARVIAARAKDRQYFRAGTKGGLKLEKLSVPFAAEPDGKPLSDHMGYVAEYSLNRDSFTQARYFYDTQSAYRAKRHEFDGERQR